MHITHTIFYPFTNHIHILYNNIFKPIITSFYPIFLIVLLIMFYNHTPKTIFIIILVLSSNHPTHYVLKSHFNINLIILSNLIFISIYSQFESVLEFRIYGQKTKVCTYMYNSTYICIYIIIFKSLCNIIFFFISINIYN